MAELVNPALARMRADEVALGLAVRLARTGEIAAVARATDHDFLFIDGQHGVFSRETVAEIAQAALGVGVAPLYRVRRFDDPDMPQLLDAGVMGIVVPDVNSPEQARCAVSACKFPPIGRRSVGGAYPALGFRPMPVAELTPLLNAETMVVCMIETLEGLSQVEAIAGVEGVDVLHIGCNDMLVNMGLPGAFGSPEIMAAIDKVIEACRANATFAGLGGDRDLERQQTLIERGIRFLTTHSDLAFLMAEASRRTQALRG